MYENTAKKNVYYRSLQHLKRKLPSGRALSQVTLIFLGFKLVSI